MTVENQGAASGGNANANAETVQKQDGAESKAVTELETLKNELAARDRKIGELQKSFKAREEEYLARELAGKTAEEQAAAYKKQLEEIEQERQLKASLAEAGLTAAEWEGVFKGGDYTERAKRASALVQEAAKRAAEAAREELKAKTLEKVAPDVPKTKSEEAMSAFKKGLGL